MRDVSIHINPKPNPLASCNLPCTSMLLSHGASECAANSGPDLHYLQERTLLISLYSPESGCFISLRHLLEQARRACDGTCDAAAQTERAVQTARSCPGRAQMLHCLHFGLLAMSAPRNSHRCAWAARMHVTCAACLWYLDCSACWHPLRCGRAFGKDNRCKAVVSLLNAACLHCRPAWCMPHKP
jgi:hypothetical protein